MQVGFTVGVGIKGSKYQGMLCFICQLSPHLESRTEDRIMCAFSFSVDCEPERRESIRAGVTTTSTLILAINQLNAQNLLL